MSKIAEIDQTAATPVGAEPRTTVSALENLAGFAEDLNNQSMKNFADPDVLEAVVKERFGPDVSVADVTEALDALRDISLGI